MDITSLMDLFVTFLDLNNISIPNDRIYDGVSLVPALFSQGHVDRDSYFLYNQGALYAVRYKQYKVHYWTRDGFSDLPPEPHYPPLLCKLNNNLNFGLSNQIFF